MKKGNIYENSMGSVIKVTSIKNGMVFITYNGKRKNPIKQEEFEKWIQDGHIVGC